MLPSAQVDRWLALSRQLAPIGMRASDLPRLRAAGPLGQLLAHQSLVHAQEAGMAALARTHAALPDDMLNFHYDPVACAVALGWHGAEFEELRLLPILQDHVLRFEPDPAGRLVGALVGLDAPAFTEAWLTAVEAAQR